MTDVGDDESELFKEEDLALDRIREKGLEPTGGPALSESADFLLPSMCLFASRVA